MSNDSHLRRLIDARDWPSLRDALGGSREFGDAALRRVASNLHALRRHRPALYAQTLEWIAERGLPMPPARVAGDAGEWIESIDPSANIVLLGLGDGRRLQTLSRIGFGPITLVEPSIDAWLGAIAWGDLAGFASDAGNDLFVGPDWRDAARRVTRADRRATVFGGAPAAALLHEYESLQIESPSLMLAA